VNTRSTTHEEQRASGILGTEGDLANETGVSDDHFAWYGKALLGRGTFSQGSETHCWDCQQGSFLLRGKGGAAIGTCPQKKKTIMKQDAPS